MIRVLPLLLLLLFPSLARALEYHGETSLYEDTIWQGEVLIDGILTVASGTTLEIRPGTRVRFTRIDRNQDGIGENEIFIQGRLLARGTAEQPILFTSAEALPQPGDWGALNMMMSEEGENLFEHCLMEYAYRGFHAHFSQATLRHDLFRYNQRGAQFQESTVVVEDCRFENNFNGMQFRDSTVSLKGCRIADNNWGVRAVYVKLSMVGCQVLDNRTNGISLRDSELQLSDSRVSGNRRGVYLQRSQGEVRGNLVSENDEHGIYLEDSIADLLDNRLQGNGRSGLKLLHAGGQISGNMISGNHQFAIVNDGPEDYQLGSNRFGDVPPQILDQRLRPELGRIHLQSAAANHP